MGVVLLARDVALDRPVAVKVLPAGVAGNPAARERFLREARTAAGLSHPHIVPIHLVEAHGDWVFFVMGYVDGDTLRERVERHGPLTPRAAIKLMQEAAWALAYAHERGIVHRDVKPDNIMIERATDRTIVMDFGIALAGTAGQSLGEVIGTARFMSPEQACGEPVDGRSDLYALGATLYFALTGRAPFEASSLPALLAKQVAEPPAHIAAARPQLSPRLATIVHRCLEKAPEARFQTGEELAAAVDAVRGRDLRAPPLVRSFLRNAQVTTMMLLAAGTVFRSGGANPGSFTVELDTGIIVFIFVGNLVLVARRLLREGYTWNDIRAALLAEAQLQDEEAEETGQRRWLRRLDGLWHRLWAGRFGRWFFRVAGVGIDRPARPVFAAADHTELVLARSVEEGFGRLTAEQQRPLASLPRVVRRLEAGVRALRGRTQSGPVVQETLTALENVRMGLLRLAAGAGSMDDLSRQLAAAQDIGRRIDAMLEAGGESRTG